MILILFPFGQKIIHDARPRKSAVYGNSHGGLLVGAAMTRRPEVFDAVICSRPVLDMLRFHRFDVGNWWVSEFDSPDDPQGL
jgi:prolyl oligopeptidase